MVSQIAVLISCLFRWLAMCRGDWDAPESHSCDVDYGDGDEEVNADLIWSKHVRSQIWCHWKLDGDADDNNDD